MQQSDREKRVNTETLNFILKWYFKATRVKLHRKVNGKIKSKEHFKEIVATLLVVILQYEAKTLTFDNYYFDGALTQVLNKHKDISFTYKDFNRLMNNFNEDKARKMMFELYEVFNGLLDKEDA